MQAVDPVLEVVLLWFSENSFPENVSDKALGPFLKAHRNGALAIKDGLLLNSNRVVIPTACIPFVLHAAHDALLAGGHSGIDRTMEKISSRYWWPKCRADVENWVSSCRICVAVKPPNRTVKAKLQSYPDSEALEVWHLDFLGEVRPTGVLGSKYVLIAVDRATRFVEVFPTKDLKATTVAEVLFFNLYPRYGIFRQVTSDQGSNFQSQVMDEFYRLLGIKKARTTPYNPKCNGICERMVKEAKLQIALYLQTCPANNWDLLLQLAVYNMRMAHNASIGMSPFRALYGVEPRP
jgi:transposase InsO family protein